MPSDASPITVRGRQLEAKYCHLISLNNDREEEVLMGEVTKIEGNIADQRTKPIGELEAFPISEKYPNGCTYVNAHLKPHQKSRVKEFLASHQGDFAFKPSDLPGIHPSVMSHRLNFDPSVILV